MSKVAILAWLLLASGISACQKSSDDAAPSAGAPASALPAQLARQQAQIALEMVEADLGAMQDGGGYQEWTAEKAIEQLVPLLNAAQAPEPGEPPIPGPRFTYVKDAATGPWQVVIKLDEAQTGIAAAAYGTDTATPLATKAIAVSRY